MELEEAVDRGRKFLLRKAGHSYVILKSVDHDDERKCWTITYDVGVFTSTIKKVVIRDSDGKIIEYH